MKSVFDGTSNTFLAGEMHIATGNLNEVPFNGPLFNGQELDSHTRIGGPGIPLLTAADEPGALFGFGSWHPGVANFAFGDGRTSSISNSLDTIILGRLCNRKDGEVTGNN